MIPGYVELGTQRRADIQMSGGILMYQARRHVL